MATYPLPIPAPAMTEEDYLARVRAEEWQAEYIHGVVYEMTGGTGSHSQIAASLTFQTGLALGDKACTVFSQSLSVHVAKVSAYFSPDLSVVCGKPDYRDGRKDLLINPKVVFEVLSPSTELYDRVTKLEVYQQIDSLQEYVLVSQHIPKIEIYRRSERFWVFERLTGLDATLDLTSLDISIPLAGIYRGVEFDAPQ